MVEIESFSKCNNPILQLWIKSIDLIGDSRPSIQPLRDDLKLLSNLDMFFSLETLTTQRSYLFKVQPKLKKFNLALPGYFTYSKSGWFAQLA